MKRLEINDILQWAGTASLLCMNAITSFAPHWHPWNIVAGLMGGLCYGAWTIRVANKPQMLVNGMGVLICIGGLAKAWS